jgi:hypothetical protein
MFAKLGWLFYRCYGAALLVIAPLATVSRIATVVDVLWFKRVVQCRTNYMLPLVNVNGKKGFNKSARINLTASDKKPPILQ